MNGQTIAYTQTSLNQIVIFLLNNTEPTTPIACNIINIVLTLLRIDKISFICLLDCTIYKFPFIKILLSFIATISNTHFDCILRKLHLYDYVSFNTHNCIRCNVLTFWWVGVLVISSFIKPRMFMTWSTEVWLF